MMENMVQRLRYAVLALGGVIWAVTNVWLGMLDNSYVNYPRVANPDAGLVIPYEVKNVVVYITSDQRFLIRCLNWAELGSAPLILVSLLLNQKWPLRWKK
jgi:hypothetical protein